MKWPPRMTWASTGSWSAASRQLVGSWSAAGARRKKTPRG